MLHLWLRFYIRGNLKYVNILYRMGVFSTLSISSIWKKYGLHMLSVTIIMLGILVYFSIIGFNLNPSRDVHVQKVVEIESFENRNTEKWMPLDANDYSTNANYSGYNHTLLTCPNPCSINRIFCVF